MWVLSTGGVIATQSVATLTRLAQILDVIQIPIILIVAGARWARPDLANTSVGIPFFAIAREALILFKDHNTCQVYIIDAKGAFELLKLDYDSGLSSWDSLPTFANDN